MRRGSSSLKSLIFLGATGGFVGAAAAGENATIWNNSNHRIDMQVAWSGPAIPPFVSPWFPLFPGQHHTIPAPNGATVSINFNSTPSNTVSPRLVSAPVAVSSVATPFDRGAFSCFQSVTPFDVKLSVVDLRSTQGVQLALAVLGFDPGPIDGFYGPQTISAVLAFQTANGLFVDGIAGEQTRRSLRSALDAKP